MPKDDLDRFLAALRRGGWKEEESDWVLTKGHWKVLVDTSSWVQLQCGDVYAIDIHVPGEYETSWTLNLIEHLCRLEDERQRLRRALVSIAVTDGPASRERTIATKVLKSCYHRWVWILPTPTLGGHKWICLVCKRTSKEAHPE